MKKFLTCLLVVLIGACDDIIEVEDIYLDDTQFSAKPDSLL